MIGLLEDLLSRQDKAKPHTLLTRLLVSSFICFAYLVLYGFYGLVAAFVFWLVGVELMSLPWPWMFYAFFLGLLGGAWQAVKGIRDYWRNFGHGDVQR